MSSEDIFSSGLDTTTVDTSNEFQVVPENRYLLAIDSIEKVDPEADENGNQADSYELIKFSIIQGEHQGRTIRFNCKLYSSNEQWRGWAVKDFACMMKAVGVTRITSEHRHSVIGKTLQAQVVITSKNGKKFNNIRDWFTADGVPVRDGAGQGKAATVAGVARPAPAAAPRPAAAPVAAPRPVAPPGAAPKFQPPRAAAQAAVPGGGAR